MAIGLGKCFGFTFCENFDYPYISLSVREFWRRWHMSLNRWFTDYLYIPLGGSRRGTAVTVRNTLIVFFCTGLWHGAGWTFILWGLWHGLLVSSERLWAPGMEALGKKAGGRALLRVYTLLAVLLGFVMFRSDSVGQGFALAVRLFSFAGGSPAAAVALRKALTPMRAVFIALGALFSAPTVPALKRRFAAAGSEALRELAADMLALAGLCLCVLAMAGGGFSPFIYQQF
jgi:alginate O-acetyltransferase complex protein AlgI